MILRSVSHQTYIRSLKISLVHITCRYPWTVRGEPGDALAELVKVSARELPRPELADVVLQHEAIHPLRSPRGVHSTEGVETVWQKRTNWLCRFLQERPFRHYNCWWQGGMSKAGGENANNLLVVLAAAND